MGSSSSVARAQKGPALSADQRSSSLGLLNETLATYNERAEDWRRTSQEQRRASAPLTGTSSHSLGKASPSTPPAFPDLPSGGRPRPSVSLPSIHRQGSLELPNRKVQRERSSVTDLPALRKSNPVAQDPHLSPAPPTSHSSPNSSFRTPGAAENVAAASPGAVSTSNESVFFNQGKNNTRRRKPSVAGTASFLKRVPKLLEQAFEENRDNLEGVAPGYFDVDPTIEYGVAATLIDGATYQYGYQEDFTLQAAVLPIVLCSAYRLIGQAGVEEYTGVEPSGANFDSFSMSEDGLPHNPLNNLGGLVLCALILREAQTVPQAFKLIQDLAKCAVGSSGRVFFDNAVYLEELEHSDRNRGLLHHLRESPKMQTLFEVVDSKSTLELYLQCCSLATTAAGLATMAATLANFGWNPLTHRWVMPSWAAKLTLQHMLASGLYHASGNFAYRVGIPAKSGVSGAFMMAAPGYGGFAVISPLNDGRGNSIRGMRVGQTLSEAVRELHYMHAVQRAAVSMTRNKVNMSENPNFVLLAAAEANACDQISRLLEDELVTDIDVRDPQGQTPLHRAIASAKTDHAFTSALVHVLDEEMVLYETRQLGIADDHVWRMWRAILHNGVTNVRDIPELPKKLYQVIEEKFALTTSRLVKEETSADNTTTKLLIELQDGAQIETVIMRYGRFELRNFPEDAQKKSSDGEVSFVSKERATVCVSSQVGCQMGCTFCATGTMGLMSNLAAGEILEQLYHANQVEKIRNVVFMGMGEPLDNYDAVRFAVSAMTDVRRFSLGASKISVSTVGVVPRIHQMVEDMPDVGLALSLHAPNQELREEIVPSGRSWHLDRIMEAIDHFQETRQETSRRRRTHILIEYVLIDEVNSTEEVAHQLGHLLKDRDVLVNVIPYNPTDVPHDYKPPSRATTDRFNEIVRSYGLRTIIRQELGQDVNAACGQLVVRSQRAKEANAAAAPAVGDLEDLMSRKGNKATEAETRARVRRRKAGASDSTSPTSDKEAAPATTTTVPKASQSSWSWLINHDRLFVGRSVPQVYHDVYAAVCPADEGRITSNTFLAIASQASIPIGDAKQAWHLSDPFRTGSIDKSGLFQALAMLALAQQGMVFTVAAVEALPELPPLKLDRMEALRAAGIESGKRADYTYREFEESEFVQVMLGHATGMLKKHTNYEVFSKRKSTTVSRRFSDFEPLDAYLRKRYPYRIIPQLPPKTFGGGNMKPEFIEHRRRGLQRYLMFVGRHPVLQDDEILTAFLTDSSSDIQLKVKDATKHVREEFYTHALAAEASELVPDDMAKRIAGLQTEIPEVMDIVGQLMNTAQAVSDNTQARAQLWRDFAEQLRSFGATPTGNMAGETRWQEANRNLRDIAALVGGVADRGDEQRLREEDGIVDNLTAFYEVVAGFKETLHRRSKGIVKDLSSSSKKQTKEHSRANRLSTSSGSDTSDKVVAETRAQLASSATEELHQMNNFSIYCVWCEAKLIKAFFSKIGTTLEELSSSQATGNKQLTAAWQTVHPVIETLVAALDKTSFGY
ncbi:uncharacterized protein MONBRDRAFT_33245 [Monosiga brevicollis MX1]|uniref:glutaminase n=1 Tax=Monosiga brevicollis TaxID=81824 RepID=A9V4C5_MONBE|nr:uncharacterized protein MONBRDRAFT_33245 [Monosiga brevicollis MX1]EDQ87591.1 predicted protein [Monosiga brevicollis MX1]|eukprot:XP_001747511.1 hypothetical protein [Monosiga brevicollis MX1]